MRWLQARRWGVHPSALVASSSEAIHTLDDKNNQEASLVRIHVGEDIDLVSYAGHESPQATPNTWRSENSRSE